MADDFLSRARVVGSFVCPHQDGDFTTRVIDMKNWATGSCMIRQEGQGQVHDLIVNREEAAKLADILFLFANGK
jgi:hypothetical protein